MKPRALRRGRSLRGSAGHFVRGGKAQPLRGPRRLRHAPAALKFFDSEADWAPITISITARGGPIRLRAAPCARARTAARTRAHRRPGDGVTESSPWRLLPALRHPFEFILFAATLLGVALLHHRTLEVAICGLASIVMYKVAITGFHEGAGSRVSSVISMRSGGARHLFGLLMGFALLSRHFEASHVRRSCRTTCRTTGAAPSCCWRWCSCCRASWTTSRLPDRRHRRGHRVPPQGAHRLHAALVAASNAGGSGSVVGDTTTTMMWIDGVSRSTCCMLTWRRASHWSSAVSRRRCSSMRTRRS